MTTYEAPAKLNLALHVRPPRSDGYHPLESLVQTIDWLDKVTLDEGEGSDSLVAEGLEFSDEDNIVLRALAAVRRSEPLPPQTVHLEKTIPVGAGMGGGSSDAAAALLAAGELAGMSSLESIAVGIGADVPLFLTGGTLMMRGIGEEIEPLRALAGFAVAAVVPTFPMVTADVYARWDELEGPEGEVVPDDLLPPRLRDGIPIRNDLLPAAIDIEPRLGDFMADVRAAWGTPVMLTGSGSACFGFFATLDEASDAAGAVEGAAFGRGVELRPRGVSRVD